MISKFNSADYWSKIIEKNKTYKGKIFLDEPITEKTVYIHTIVFNKKSGLENVWAPIPNMKMLLGYIQYCFLPVAYQKWFDGREGNVSKTPIREVSEIVKEMSRKKSEYKEELKNIKRDIDEMKKLWDLPIEKLPRALKHFCREFNKTWIGDSNEFIYIKILVTPSELLDFINYTQSMVSSDTMEEMIGISEDELQDICENAASDKDKGDMLKKVLTVDLVEMA